MIFRKILSYNSFDQNQGQFSKGTIPPQTHESTLNVNRLLKRIPPSNKIFKNNYVSANESN